jgi:hypothetical protein
VQILRGASRVLCAALLGLSAAALMASGADVSPPLSEPPGPPPGIPAAGPDTAPLPPGTDSPAYDAIRQRCAIALDQRSCIEAAKRDETTRRPPDPPAH